MFGKGKSSLLESAISSKNISILLLKSVLHLKLLPKIQIKTVPWGCKWRVYMLGRQIDKSIQGRGR